jgi:multiple sugar transport system substrate-binding protein
MKKVLVLALAMAGVLVLAACGNRNTSGGGNLDGEIGGEITISTFDSMTTYPLLREAARLFMDIHPGTVVRVETFAPMPIQTEDGRIIASGGGERDYINRINTELMSGRGADILAMDILPFYEYARNGQLVNLLEFMQNDPHFDFDDYQTALFDSLTTDRGMFVFPMVYFFWFLTYNASQLNESQQEQLMSESVFSFNRLLEISQPANSHLFQTGAFMQKRDMTGLFYQMFMQNYSHFIDVTNREANFTDGVFEALLNQAALWERNGYIQPRGGSLYATVPSTMLMMAYVQEDSLMRDIFGMSNNPKLAGVMGSDTGEAMFSIRIRL